MADVVGLGHLLERGVVADECLAGGRARELELHRLGRLADHARHLDGAVEVGEARRVQPCEMARQEARGWLRAGAAC